MLERARRIPANVRAVSVVSLVNDLASELAYPVIPLFVTTVIGAPVAVLGLIEGVAEGAAVALGAASGWISDRAGGRRVPWIAGGYTLTALSRAVVAAATAWGLVLLGRLADRTGKALRTAPRDALIRDSSDPALVGASFGFHRALDTVGASIGPLVAVVLIAEGVSLRDVLWISVLPGLRAVLLVRRVHEAPVHPAQWAVWPLFAFYGLYVAATDGVLKAWVADHVGGPMAGTAYGIYAGLVGGALLAASLLGGILWTAVSPAATFWVGAAFAAASLPLVGVAARAGHS